ncbi:MAG: hypothetical protein JNK53_08660 [Phycisphaerae bacterium]|nr:hypothetical protein [Phycisphaerae bacterium]
MAIDKHWNVAGTANWHVAGNWSPAGIPGGADNVFVGSTLAAENGWVNLTGNASAASLSITDGMMVDLNTSQMTVGGAVTIAGYNTVGQTGYPSRLRVGQSMFIFDCTVDSAFISDQGSIEISDGGALRVNNLLSIGASCGVGGYGLIYLYGNNPAALANNGSLSPAVEGLTINQMGSGRVDLDGSVAGDGTLNITLSKIDGSDFADLTINGDALADPMDDHVWIGGNCTLNMNLANGWSMGTNAILRFSSNLSHPGPAELNGDPFTHYGSMEFSGTGAHGQINAGLTLGASAIATLGVDDRLECTGATTVEGGTYTLDEDARIDFQAATTVRGGTFNTFSAGQFDGGVNFNGQTSWDGNVVINGFGNQAGNASVAGPSVITAQTFDLDGGAGTAQWSVGNGLTINANSIEPSGFNKFDGTINISGTFLGKLTLNGLAGDTWVMDGTMNLGGAGGILVDRIAGARMRLFGALNLQTKSGITADLEFNSGSITTFALPSTLLRTSGTTQVLDGSIFVGDGTLQNAAGGTLTLAHNVNLQGVGVQNDGTLHLGSSPGTVFVDRLTCGPASVLAVEIGGYTPGVQHDLLFVTPDATQLDGALDVKVIDIGNGVFVPQVGDRFTILRASGALNGTFTNSPVSYGSGNVYFWTVNIGNDIVELELDSVILCAADLNSDGIVNGGDLGILLAAWGPCKGCQADLNGDGTVGGADLGTLLGAWGPCF